MHVQHRIVLVISLLVILTWAHGLEAKKLNKQICPIGFKVAYNRAKGDHICYKRKELEPFSAVLDDCDGNLYSSKLHNSLDIFKLEYSDILWSEYKSFYPGGPFVSWSRNDREWSVVTDVNNYDPYSLRYDISQDLCLAVNRTGEYIAVQCDDKYYRYCFVKPYSDVDDMRRKGCEGFRGSYRFVNSKDICLLGVTGVGGGTVRATWNQSQALCSRHGGTLLSRGWQYANVPMFHISDVSPTSTYPLGIVWDPERKVLRYVSEDNVIEKPFEMSSWNSTDDTMFIAIKDESWTPVNSSYIFFDVICEHSVQLRNLTLTLSVNPDNKIILDVNDSVDKDDVHCTTDSESYRPTKVKIHHDDDEDNYVLSPATDGYYWCEHIDRYNFQSTQSNKVLFVRERESLINLYSVKIKLINDNYTFSNAAKKKEFWIDQLQEYVFYRTKYVQMFDVEKILNPIEAQKILRDFKASRTELRWRDSEAIYNSVVKRLYMNKNTVLLHVELNPEMIPVTPGFWGNIEVVAMKPAYYCKGFDSVPRLSIAMKNQQCIPNPPKFGKLFDGRVEPAQGETTLTRGCRTYSCLGDFNEGVQWLETETNDCVPSSSVPMTVTILSDVTMKMPTLGTLPSTTTKDEYLDIVEEDVDAEDVSEYNPDDIRNETFTTESSYEKNVMTEETVSVTDESGEDEEEATTFITTRRYPIWPPYTTVPVTVVDTPRPTTVDPPITVNPTITPPPETTTPPPETTTPPLAPDEQLEQVIHDLEQLLQDDSVPLTVDMVDDAFDQVNSILEVEDDLTIPGDLLHMLDELGNRISLNGSHTASAIRGNVALLMADAAPDKPVRGVRMAVMDPNSDTFTNDTFDFINSEINSTQIASNKSEAVVYLPESVTSSPRRISFVIFRNERAFRGNQTVVVNSRIVSVNVENVTEFEEGEVIDIYLAPNVEDPDSNASRACAYWRFLSDGGGRWARDGCGLVPAAAPGLLAACRCDHLTHFAEILVPRTDFSETSEDALEILSIVGCGMSLFGITLIIVTALVFRAWRREFSNKIWLQLCVAIFVLVLCFMIIVFAKFDGYDVGCMVVGIALHYSVLASFCWMLVAAVISYRRLVLVFTREISHKLLRASAFSWGAPFAVVGVLLSVDPHSYAGRFEETTPSGSFCYPSGLGLWLAVYAPIAVMLLANWVLFILIVRSVFASRRIQRHGDANEALRCACVSCLLVFLFGLPWIFGLFAYNVVAAYFFTCTATFQGFILFVFIVLGNKKTRDLWLDKLKIKRTRKILVTTSTYTNRSVGGGGWRAPERSTSSLEAKNLKPKSLSQDDSRFS